MASAFENTPQLLEQHAQSMRRLAQQLLRDADEAEDVVQETWMEFLRRPGRALRGNSAAGWLHSVAGNLARNKRRGNRRRQRREEEHARPEAVADLGPASEARGRVMRGVTEAVMALDEPYRSVILMRFFEDLPPREIALRLDVPIATIKSQLQRAMLQLRVNMSRSLGQEELPWEPQLGMAFGLPLELGLGASPLDNAGPALATGSVGPLGSMIPLGALLMKLALIGGAAATLLVSLYLVHSGKFKPDSPLQRPASAVLSEPTSQGDLTTPKQANMASSQPEQKQERAEIASSIQAAITPASLPEHLFRISGTVFDKNDRPLAGVPLFIGPAGHPLNSVGSSNDEGSFDFEWAGKVSSMEIILGVSNSSARGIQLQRLKLAEGHTQGLRLSSEAAQLITIRFDAGEAGTDHQIVRGVLLNSLNRSVLTVPSEMLACSHDANGLIKFVDLPPLELDLECPLVEIKKVTTANLAKLSKIIALNTYAKTLTTGLALESLATYKIGSSFIPGIPESVEHGRIEGRIFDAQGAPVKQCMLTLSSGQETQSDAQGFYRFENVKAGPIDFMAGGGSHGLASAQIDLRPGETYLFDATLKRRLELRVQLTDHDQNPLAKREVLLSTRHPDGLSTPWEDRAISDEQGFFAIPNCPPGALALYVFPETQGSPVSQDVFQGLGARHFNKAPTDFETYEALEVTAQGLGSLALALQSSSGQELPERHFMRLTQSGSGLVIESPFSKGLSLKSGLKAENDLPVSAMSSMAFEHLAPGNYQLEILTGAAGYLNYGSIYVGPGGATDLGLLSLARPSNVLINLDNPKQREQLSGATLQLSRLGPLIDSQVGVIPALHGQAYGLAPGKYRLEGTLGSRHFMVLFELRADQVLGLNLELLRGQFTCSVTPYDGAVHDAPLLGEELQHASCSACHR